MFGRAIADLESSLPGWWWSFGVRYGQAHIRCAPDVNGPDAFLYCLTDHDVVKVFDSGFAASTPCDNITHAFDLFRDLFQTVMNDAIALRTRALSIQIDGHEVTRRINKASGIQHILRPGERVSPYGLYYRSLQDNVDLTFQTDIPALEQAIALMASHFPGWEWGVGSCSISRDASVWPPGSVLDGLKDRSDLLHEIQGGILIDDDAFGSTIMDATYAILDYSRSIGISERSN